MIFKNLATGCSWDILKQTHKNLKQHNSQIMPASVIKNRTRVDIISNVLIQYVKWEKVTSSRLGSCDKD